MAAITVASDWTTRRLGRLPVRNEPNWITGDLKSAHGIQPISRAHRMGEPKASYSKSTRNTKVRRVDEEGPIQQSDLLKPLEIDICNYGLNYTYQKWCEEMPAPEEYSKTQKGKKVIVVGAGMAGLVAAYELIDRSMCSARTRLSGFGWPRSESMSVSHPLVEIVPVVHSFLQLLGLNTGSFLHFCPKVH